MFGICNSIPISLISIAILIRWLTGQFPYSGNNKPPLYGDYEAQRHWMEITTNLPVENWYKNTTDNDLQYWGLDYPPLTAYHMFALGYVSKKFINASWTELHTSRGTEGYEHKLFMRASVLVADLLIFMPAVVYYFYKTKPMHYASQPINVHKQNLAIYTALVLLYPAQILIDHGHFQYNCVFLGLVLIAIIMMIEGNQKLAATFFTQALCYKQMSLYYSLPFFWLIASRNLRMKPFWKGILNILLVGVIVLFNIGLVFSPYLGDPGTMLQVLHRIFPFQRGVFEDKVANFWYFLSVFYKFRTVYPQEYLLKASTILTLLSTVPASIHLLLRPEIRTFRYSLVNISMMFFLLSFQVHEKTILVPALPILLLYREHPMAVNWFAIISTFSLQPLLAKDGQLVPYFVLMIVYTLFSLEIFRSNIALNFTKLHSWHNFSVIIYLTSILGCFILNIISLTVTAPSRYPDLHQALNALYSFGHFVVLVLYFYYRQFFRPTQQKPISADRVLLIKKTK